MMTTSGARLDDLDIPALDEDIRSRWAGEKPQPLVFIMGLHRSGTTLLYQYLNQLLPVTSVTIQDVVFFPRLVHSHLRDEGRADRERLLEYFEANGMSRRWLDDIPLSPETVEEYGWILAREAGSFRLTDKTLSTFQDLTRKVRHLRPAASALVLKNPWDTPHADEIARVFPDARFVFLRRDPIEILNSELRNGLSLYAHRTPLVQLLTRGMPRLRTWLGLSRISRRVLGERRFERVLVWWLYKDIVNNLQGYRTAMEGVPPHRTVQVTYRELVDETAATLRRVASFLGLPLSDTTSYIHALRRGGGLLPIVANKRHELTARLKNEGFDWALGA